MKLNKYLEVETKYSANLITLTDFTKVAKSRDPEFFVMASGFDHFYSNTQDKDSFCRHRIGPDMNQLTFKRKTIDKNNFIRTERNIDLSMETTEESIKGLCEEFGYQANNSMFKTCFVYRYVDHILVYYICYNRDLEEQGRYIEIEAREDYNWKSEQEAWDTVVAIERILKSQGLGISPQSRIRKSLYEIFRKELK